MADFRVVAIISAFNEADIISPVIGHLVENGVDVYLIDNHSTDDTAEQARPWLRKGLLGIQVGPSRQAAPRKVPVLRPKYRAYTWVRTSAATLLAPKSLCLEASIDIVSSIPCWAYR